MSGRRPRTTHGRTNRLAASASAPELNRRRETATFGKTLAARTKDWSTEASEASAAIWGGVINEETWQERRRNLRERAVEAYNKRVFVRARDKLQQLAGHRFGSLEQMFRSCLPASASVITLEEFSTLLKRQKLENVFPREYQRVIFEALDGTCEDRLDVAALVSFLNSSDEAVQMKSPVNTVPLPESDQEERGAELGFEKREIIVDKPLLPHLLRTKDDLVSALYQKTRSEKSTLSAVCEGAVTQKQYLLNAFKQKDEDMDGWLSPDTLVEALGPQHVNLGVDDDKLYALVNSMPKDDRGRVNYARFVRFLELTDIEPDYNPFFDHRNRDLLNLKRLSEASWTWPAHDVDESHKHLEPPPGSTDETASVDAAKRSAYIQPLFTSAQLEHYNTLLLKKSSAAVKRPATSSGDVFADIRATKNAQLRAICPRFVPPPPTDWTRTGLGGTGIDRRSGLFLDPAKRFQTTTNRYYDGGARRSDAEQGAVDRRSKAAARKHRNLANDRAREDQKRKLAERSQMNDDQRLKMKATEMYGYLRNAFEQDLLNVRKSAPAMMQRRASARLFNRTWGGSAANMLHPCNRSNSPEESWTTSHQIGYPRRALEEARPVTFVDRVAQNEKKAQQTVLRLR